MTGCMWLSKILRVISVFTKIRTQRRESELLDSMVCVVGYIAAAGQPADVNLSAITNFYLGFGERCNDYLPAAETATLCSTISGCLTSHRVFILRQRILMVIVTWI